MKKFIIIDGNAILHRAFHALPPTLTNSKGEVINAVYGFFSMFLNVISDQKPTHVLVCFDRPKPTFRQSLFAGYQQHRPKMADDLVPQIQILHDALAIMKTQIFEVDGYEADDLIGTLAEQAVSNAVSSKQATSDVASCSNDIEVIIVSGDRDLLQLVNSRVKVLAPVTGVKNTILFDSAKVEEKFGITPGQIVDYKALVGDASDGYPGVAGIGPKTAADLLQRFGTLEGVYEHLGELNPKVSEKLANDAEQAGLCKQLATIVTDAPVTLHPEECAVSKFDIEGLRKEFKEHGFKSLTGRLETVFGSPEKNAEEKKKEESKQLGLLD